MLKQVVLQEKHTMKSSTVHLPKELMLVLYELRVKSNMIQIQVASEKLFKRQLTRVF